MLWRQAVCLLLLGSASLVHAQDAAALHARYLALQTQLNNNQFNKPLHLESSEQSHKVRGDVYARLDQPFAVAGPELLEAARWCDILMLHLNVKSCRAHSAPSGASLIVHIGRKSYQPEADAHEFVFKYLVVTRSANYQQVMLQAPSGPLGTSDYRIALEVVDIDTHRSFVHLSYEYQYGAAARLAMQGYLATAGRNKVGFTRIGTLANGQPEYIGGQRAVAERNTMRYYLAIVAYLGARSAPAAQQVEQRLNDWFSSVEKYPMQLHELSRQQYLDMKHREMAQDQAVG